jgi:hypothetical protein
VVRDVGAEQRVKEEVAVQFGRLRRGPQEQPHAQAEPRPDRRRRPAVVGLEPAVCDERVGPLGQRVGHDIFQLTDLVPRRFQAGQVVPLDQDPVPPERPGEVVEFLDRGREGRQFQPLRFVGVHGGGF